MSEASWGERRWNHSGTWAHEHICRTLGGPAGYPVASTNAGLDGAVLIKDIFVDSFLIINGSRL